MKSLSPEEIKDLEFKANSIRESIIEMLLEAGSGHSRLVLSNGHICPVLYATMAHAGYFPITYLKKLRKFNSPLQGHPHREWLSGLETSSGPLGAGLSQAVGMALADRIDKGRESGKSFYCLLGDGELDEGQNWEAFMLAGKEKLHNVIAIIDRNNIQIDGFTEDIMPLDSLAKKLEAFNWHVQEIDGHNMQDIFKAIGEAQATFERPSVIIAHTIPGKGVPFMERHFEWHGTPPGISDIAGAPPKAEQGKVALEALRTLGGRIKAEHEAHKD